jgi:hypothetical protein
MTEDPAKPVARWQILAGAVSSVVAPITLVTALLVYAAWTRTKTFFAYFGVDSSILGLSVQEYLLRSADTAFGLLAWIAVAWLTVLVAARVGSRLIGLLKTRWRRRIHAVVAWLALACVLVGLLSIVWPVLSGALSPYGAAAILSGGSLVLARSRRGLGHPGGSISDDLTRAALVVIVALAAFWTATDYARDLGTREAENVDRQPDSLAEVDLYSAEPLDMPGSLVSSSGVNVTPSTMSYRYIGLRLLEFSNDRWLVITGRRENLHSSVLILKDSDDIRVQIASPMAQDLPSE